MVKKSSEIWECFHVSSEFTIVFHISCVEIVLAYICYYYVVTCIKDIDQMQFCCKKYITYAMRIFMLKIRLCAYLILTWAPERHSGSYLPGYGLEIFLMCRERRIPFCHFCLSELLLEQFLLFSHRPLHCIWQNVAALHIWQPSISWVLLLAAIRRVLVHC